MDQVNTTAKSQNVETSSHDGLFEDFVKSVGYSALAAPVTAVGQLFDSKFQFLPQLKPGETKTGSLAYYVEGVGSAVGLLADVAVLKGRLGALGDTQLGRVAGLSSVMESKIGSLALTGTVYGGLLTPVDGQAGDQFSARFKNAAITGGTFAALGATSEFLSKSVPIAPQQGFLGAAQRIGLNAASGIPVGLMNAEANSLAFRGRLANGSELAQTGIDWGIVGGVLAVPDVVAKGAGARRLSDSSTSDRQSLAATTSPGEPLMAKLLAVSDGRSAYSGTGRGAEGDAAIKSLIERNGGLPEQSYLRGVIGRDGVWSPVRDVHDLPLSSKMELLRKFKTGLTPLMKPQVVDDFVSSVNDTAGGWKPLPADAPDEVVKARAAQLETTINQFADRHNLPHLKVVEAGFGDSEALVSGKMLFDSQEGYISMPRSELLANPDAGSPTANVLAARLLHEVNHGQQIYDIAKSAIPSVASGKQIDSLARMELKETLDLRLRANMSPDFIARLADNYEKDPTPVTSQLHGRAMELSKSFSANQPPPPGYAYAADRVVKSKELLDQLDKPGGRDQVLAQLKDKAVQSEIFGRQVPDSVSRIAEQGVAEPGKAELADILLANIDAQNSIRLIAYRNYMQYHELESWLVQQKAMLRGPFVNASQVIH